jgi:iron complex outermembrane recepter protein
MFRSTPFRRASAGAFALAFASSSSLAQEALPAIDVGAGEPAATNNTPAPGPATATATAKEREKAEEHSYTRAYATTATKTDTPILDTPRSIVVVPKQVLEDNQVLSSQEAVKFVSGVQSSSPLYDIFLIRGFSTASNEYRNGLKLFQTVDTEDPAFLDRVDILKGPAAMLYGRVQPGGIVNFVTKRPQEEAANSIQTQFGSWGLSRTTIDTTGPLTTDKSLLYRVVGVFDRADNFMSFQSRENGAVLGELTWRPTSRFEANLQVEHYNLNSVEIGSYAGQIPAMALAYAAPGIVGRPANIPRNFTQNDPGLLNNFPDTRRRELIYGDWTYHIDDSWKATYLIHYNHSQEHSFQLYFTTVNPVTGIGQRQLDFYYMTNDTVSQNFNVTGETTTGDLKHNLLFGFDNYQMHLLAKGDNPKYVDPAIPALNIFAPFYGNIAWPILQAESWIAQGNIMNRVKQEDTGYYFQDDISYQDKLHLLLGTRFDIAFDASSETGGASSTKFYGVAPNAGLAQCFPICDGHYNPPWKGNPTERKFSPNAGLLFKITPEYSIYSSWSQSFASSNAGALSYNGAPFQPEQAWQYEVGAKASLYGGKLTGSIAAFDLHRTNVLSADPQHTGFSVQSGEVRSMGIEGDVAGQITDNISLIASYTYDDAIIIRDTTTGTGAQLGKRWPGVPRHAGNLWAKYDTAPGRKEGWIFGAGFYANGERQGNNTNSWQLPGYVRFDTMLGYRTVFEGLPVETQLNVVNIGDARYFEAPVGNYAFYGAPRTFKGSIKVSF